MIERFAQLPSSLKARARWERFGPSGIPTLLVHPDWESRKKAPIVLWMHGRTVSKELDPGRYLRWMRAGIGACGIDLPGHGERLDPVSHTDEHAFEVVRSMADEIDTVMHSLSEIGTFDMDRVGIGGMSAGGMAALVRLCRPHRFLCASVESTTGAWQSHRNHGMFRLRSDEDIASLDPLTHLDQWREIPFQAFHSRLDKRISFEGQAAFIDGLRSRYADPSLIDFVTFDSTGVADEHSGFGVHATEAKDRQRDFFCRWLLGQDPASDR